MESTGQGARWVLARGVILWIGSRKNRLVDLANDRRVEVREDLLPVLQEVAGHGVGELEPALSELAAQGYLVRGTPGPDAFLRERLQQLDGEHWGPYQQALGERARLAHNRVLEAHATRKVFWGRVGQCPVLPETALRRALLVGDAAVVGKKRVLCFGDDDLVSIALATLGHEVVSIDVDDSLLLALDATAKAAGLSITTCRYDARDPLPPELGGFDVVLTDPMSNRACFELFVSRALALLRPDGVAHVAVYPAAARLFGEVAQELGLHIRRWRKKHNRYYSTMLSLEVYESDWVEVAPTASMQLRPPAAEFAVPKDLYQEDLADHPPTLLAFFDAIEGERYTRPLYLEMLMDILAPVAELSFLQRHTELAQDWTVVQGTTLDGHVTVHADRPRRQLTVRIVPFSPLRELALREVLLSAYKPALRGGAVMAGRSVWDLRLS